MCVDFNVEIFLEFNLASLHLLDDLVEQIYEVRKKQYVFNTRPDTGENITHFSQLVDPKHGASIPTYRRIGEEKSRFPLKFWAQNN